MKFFSLITAGILCTTSIVAQKEHIVACIAFYNVENLFDTIDSPDTDDFEFTPKGPNLYNSMVYFDKLEKLSKVISEIGTDFSVDGAAIIGVSEIENRSVLEDLVSQPALASRGYKIIHQDSKDGRGVDVALLYQPKYFRPDTSFFIPLITSDPDDTLRYSRDILFTAGKLNGEKISFTVNHWPSRRGGELATAALRNKAACINKEYLHTLATKGFVKSIIMGDLNDDPVNDSVRKHLKSSRRNTDLGEDEMYNPMEDLYRKGLGTTAYQDAWSVFDQIIVSDDIVKDVSGYHFYKAGIYNPAYLTQKTGSFKGYPFRTYSHGSYAGGYSDHFPVYILLVKSKE